MRQFIMQFIDEEDEKTDQEELEDEFTEVLDDDERQAYLDFREKKDEKNNSNRSGSNFNKQYSNSRVPLFL